MLNDRKSHCALAYGEAFFQKTKQFSCAFHCARRIGGMPSTIEIGWEEVRCS